MGIESYYNDELKGTDGETMYAKDAYGYQMGDAYYTIEPVSGSNIYLTLLKHRQGRVQGSFRTQLQLFRGFLPCAPHTALLCLL